MSTLTGGSYVCTGSALVTGGLTVTGYVLSLGSTTLPVSNTCAVAGTASVACLSSTGNLNVASSAGFVRFSDSGTNKRGILGTVGASDYWYVGGGATSTDNGFMELSTGKDGTEPIYVRQYGSSTAPPLGTVTRQATLLDASGNTAFPGGLTVGGSVYSGGLITGVPVFLQMWFSQTAAASGVATTLTGINVDSNNSCPLTLTSGTGTFTNNTTRTLLVDAMANVCFPANATGYRSLYFLRSDATIFGQIYIPVTDTDNVCANTVSTFPLTAGQSFTVVVLQTSGASMNIGGTTNLSGNTRPARLNLICWTSP